MVKINSERKTMIWRFMFADSLNRKHKCFTGKDIIGLYNSETVRGVHLYFKIYLNASNSSPQTNKILNYAF